jgi:hypothetical protein
MWCVISGFRTSHIKVVPFQRILQFAIFRVNDEEGDYSLILYLKGEVGDVPTGYHQTPHHHLYFHFRAYILGHILLLPLSL